MKDAAYDMQHTLPPSQGASPRPTGHFRLLDGLRGVAAVSVVAYHFAGRGDLSNLLPRGYLAVDFFFVLSGFVVAHAYADRLRTSLTAARFVLLRLIRLLPMLVPGSILGALMEIWRPGVSGSLRHLGEVGVAAVLGCVAIPWPFPTTMEQTIFPINGPVWSLFFEIVANGIFVITAKSLAPRASAIALTLVGCVGIMICALVIGKIDAGPLVTDWLGGFPRVMYSFFAGVLLSGSRQRFPQWPAWTFPCVLVAIFSVPVFDGRLSMVFDALVVLLGFPMMVGCALRSVPPEGLLKACDVSGEISYPIYAIHYPIVRAICFVMNKSHPTVVSRLGLAAASVLLICVISWLALKLYDRPFRRFLGRRLLVAQRARDGSPAEQPGDTRKWA